MTDYPEVNHLPEKIKLHLRINGVAATAGTGKSVPVLPRAGGSAPRDFREPCAALFFAVSHHFIPGVSFRLL
jgi:hypothetical protein